MRKTDLERKIKESIFFSELTGKKYDYQIDRYIQISKTRYRMYDIEKAGYSKYSEYQKW
jgi:hypothetical protein